MAVKITDLRKQAIVSSLFRPGTLQQAVERLGFVQADPIRSPARAQDLILRHRVKDYRVGDLDDQYQNLSLEEDLLYAYGFMPRSTWCLLHPRDTPKRNAAEKRVLAFVTAQQRHVHPRDLEAGFGRNREQNDWGGQSTATTRVLQSLHYSGALRVAGRQSGIRVYEPVEHTHEPLDPAERLHKLVMLVATILGPLPESSLRATLRHLAYAAPGLDAGRKSIVKKLIESGELAWGDLDGLRYVWPSTKPNARRANETVRFLAPFDPLVWDRRRFEHLWGWPYRFEAYTPAAKRQLGYYAMPMLWRDDVVGWVNVSTDHVRVEPGFKKTVTDPKFRDEYEAEVERMKTFLQRR